ncbi:MAG: UDP-N-acetylmuramate dehydrogenase [Patescibacteria group bacterium]
MSDVNLKIQKDMPLAQYTSFKIGGPARFFILIKKPEELSQAFAWAKEKKLPVLILGGGSNVLMSDAGWPGLVVKISITGLQIKKLQATSYKLQVGAGEATSAVAREVSKRGLKGMEWAVGIPGTFGGAIRGNAGAFRFDTAQVIKTVEVWRDGKIIKLSKDDCGFSYRNSFFKSKFKNDIILSAELEMEQGNPAEVQAQVKYFLDHRDKSQPKQSSAGCFFKNFAITDKTQILKQIGADHGLPEEFIKHKKIPAGWLVEQAGLKGTQVGQAQVSTIHGNFIINLGGATAKDVLALVKKIKKEVKNRLGVDLEEEVQIVR